MKNQSASWVRCDREREPSRTNTSGSMNLQHVQICSPNLLMLTVSSLRCCPEITASKLHSVWAFALCLIIAKFSTCELVKSSAECGVLTDGGTHCVSWQSWLPFHPHDSRLTLEAMKKKMQTKFILLSCSSSAKYKFIPKQNTHIVFYHFTKSFLYITTWSPKKENKVHY